MEHYVDKDKLQEFTTKLTAKNKTIFATKTDVGSPLVASLVADMTDEDKIYVYVGSETGYTYGNWYYYDGSAWTSGGIYNAAAVATDKTLSEEDKAADAKAVGDALDTKADVDGGYEDLAAGQLLSTIYNEDKVPYKFRTSGGSADIGNRLTDKIVGGTIAWNQLVQNGDFSDGTSGWTANLSTFFSIAATDGVLTATVLSTPTSYYRGISHSSITIPIGHVLFVSVSVKQSYGTHDVGITNTAVASAGVVTELGDGWYRRSKILKTNATTHSAQTYVGSDYASYSTDDYHMVKDFVCFDLTQMFGETIADYIYSLEQATTGAGVAWFKKLFPLDYYEYNAGELLSVSGLSSHDMVGFNTFDYSTGLAKLVGGNEYQITGTYTSVSYEDINGDSETLTIDSDGYFTPTNNGTMTVTGGNSTDTCVHLVWSGYRDGEFEDYVKHSYALDDSLTLRGIPKLDSSNNLYYDGDTYESDGTVTRKYGSITFDGSADENWNERTGYTNEFYVRGSTSDAYVISSSTQTTVIGAVSNRLIAGTWANFNVSQTADIALYYGQPWIIIRDTNSSDVSELRSNLASNPLTVVYLLATETTESADPYTNPQIVDDFGTEEYVSTSIVPVGHETQYMANLRDKLQHLPDLADNDGTYLITQSNKQMSLTVYNAPTGLPTAPTTDGTYTLQATVSDGAVTYSWV